MPEIRAFPPKVGIKATKVHTCDGCGSDIQPGESYNRWPYLDEEGNLQVQKFHNETCEQITSPKGD